MENKLKRLFDFQRFEQNKRISDLINDTGKRYSALTDEDLELVNAAGEIILPRHPFSGEEMDDE